MKVEDAIKELQALEPGTDIIMIAVAKKDFDESNEEAANETSEYGRKFVEPTPPEEWERLVHNYERADGGQHYAFENVIEYLFENPVESKEEEEKYDKGFNKFMSDVRKETDCPSCWLRFTTREKLEQHWLGSCMRNSSPPNSVREENAKKEPA